VSLVLGDPIKIPRDASEDDLEKCRKTVEDSLNAISAIRE
jgi:lysophospholipid acyltransferase (LPLAT)-like uncharacterized protein